MRAFKPTTKVKMAGATINAKPVMLAAEPIKSTGGALVVTEWDRGRTYGVTHVGTGGSVTGNPGAHRNITVLVRRAGAFWSSLTDEQREVWRTSSDPAAIRAATPADALSQLRVKK